MRKRFWTTRKNKYKHRTRKQKKPRHKRIKSKKMKGGGELPFTELGFSSIINSVSNPMSTYIPTSGNVISSPYVSNQFTQVPGLHT